MFVNPVNGDMFPKGGMQPGMLSGEINYIIPTKKDMDNVNLYVSGTKKGNEYLVKLVTADMAVAGLDFQPYKDGMTGGYKVALVVNPGVDYH